MLRAPQVAFVTGASSGMGLAAARAFAAAITLADINGHAAGQAAKELADAGHQALALLCDVTDEDQVAAMVAGGEPDRGQAETGQAIGRLGTAEEIAQAVLWLCSPGAGYVTGVALPGDGGYTAQ